MSFVLDGSMFTCPPKLNCLCLLKRISLGDPSRSKHPRCQSVNKPRHYSMVWSQHWNLTEHRWYWRWWGPLECTDSWFFKCCWMGAHNKISHYWKGRDQKKQVHLCGSLSYTKADFLKDTMSWTLLILFLLTTTLFLGTKAFKFHDDWRLPLWRRGV